MRYDSVPSTLNNSTSLQAGLKTEGISLNLSSRSKIVIRPLLQRPAPSSTAAKAVIPGPSIFSSKSKKFNAESATPQARPTVPQKGVLKPSRSSSHSTTSPKKERSSGPARVEKLEKAKLAKAHATVAKRVRIVEPPKTVVMPPPTPVVTSAAGYSPYAEEYAKCGCTTDSQPPCQRCQLMLLADKFCDLVYKQCEKWNIQI